MALVPLPPTPFTYDDWIWVTTLCRDSGGNEWTRPVYLYWGRLHWNRSNLLGRGLALRGWPWAPTTQAQADYQHGRFVPWFEFVTEFAAIPILLDTGTGYQLSRGANATMYPRLPEHGLGDLGWLVDLGGAEIQGFLLHVSFRAGQPRQGPPCAFSRFAIWRASTTLARLWRRRRWHRWHSADQVRVALGRGHPWTAFPDAGTMIGTYLAGPPIRTWVDAD